MTAVEIGANLISEYENKLKIDEKTLNIYHLLDLWLIPFVITFKHFQILVNKSLKEKFGKKTITKQTDRETINIAMEIYQLARYF